MNQEQDHMALAALLAAGQQSAPEMDPAILRKAYDIERTFQFEESREACLKSLQKLVDELVGTGAIS